MQQRLYTYKVLGSGDYAAVLDGVGDAGPLYQRLAHRLVLVPALPLVLSETLLPALKGQSGRMIIGLTWVIVIEISLLRRIVQKILFPSGFF